MKGQQKSSSGRTVADDRRPMSETNGIQQIVERIVAQVLDSHVSQLRQDLVRRVLDELPTREAQVAAVPTDTAANLLKAISAIHAGTSQKEILRALLDSSTPYCGRAALFVIKAGAATGWQGRGFGDKPTDNDEVKDFSLDVNTGLAAQAMESRIVSRGAASEMDPHFISRFQAPRDDSAMVLPLLLKEKIAALVYADAGLEAGGTIDAAALEVLVMATSAWLEVSSLRKLAHKEGAIEAGGTEKPEPVASSVQTVSSFSDPFAAHAPKHLETARPPVAVQEPATVVEPVAVAAAAAAPVSDPSAPVSAEEADIQRKAQRFARLLVDEIKLYNQAKVAEGRKHKDLYDRLKEDIEKSRGTYKKRYGNTAAASTDYFNQELVRSLAEDDSSIMGANFRR
jgi:hypothetical protein